MRMLTRQTALSLSLLSAFAAAPLGAQVVPQTVSKPYLTVEAVGPSTVAPEFSRFAPKAQTKTTRLDYSIWDEALANVVVDFGPSLRQRALRPDAIVGSRRFKGHKSPYRLEGSRVTFAYLNDQYREGLTLYRQELEDLASQIDLTRLSRDEQLAYWLNLHNVALIEQIALEYPIDRPGDIKIRIDGKKVKLDEAKFLNVMGQKISLNDIRTQIVYPNWNDPDVMYGFFRGNIGSPKMSKFAYKATNLDYQLSDNAREFVNSLRGFHEAYDARKVSYIYEEAKPFYFQNWSRDLESHLRQYAERDTVDDLNSGKPFEVDRYEAIIADLSAGNGLGTSASPIAGQRLMSAETRRLLTEVSEKQRQLRIKGITGQPRGYVIIEDLFPEEDEGLAPPTILTEDD